MSREARLHELGLHLPDVAKPLASYVPAIRTGNLIFVSGQLPFVDGRMPLEGKVGQEVDAEQARGLAQAAALNAVAAAANLAGGLEQIKRVVKLTGYVASVPGFTDQPEVINGASDLLTYVFHDEGQHARAAVGVPVLPRNATVEVELIVEVG